MTPEANKQIAKWFLITDQRLDRLRNGYRKDLIKAYEESYREVRRLISEMYAQYGDDLTLARMTQYNRLTNLEKQIAEELGRLNGKSRRLIEGTIKDTYFDSYYYTWYATESLFDFRMNFGILSKGAAKEAMLNPFDRIIWPERLKDHTEALNRKTREIITQGIIQGQSNQQMSRNIRDRFEITGGKAFKIARTESHRAQIQANIFGFEKAENIAESRGFRTIRKWVASLDSKTRDSHRYMDGRVANKAGLFELRSGVLVPGPGLTGIPEEDINCRCIVVIEIVEIPYKTRRFKLEKKIDSYKNYKQWHEGRLAA